MQKKIRLPFVARASAGVRPRFGGHAAVQARSCARPCTAVNNKTARAKTKAHHDKKTH